MAGTGEHPQTEAWRAFVGWVWQVLDQGPEQTLGMQEFIHSAYSKETGFNDHGGQDKLTARDKVFSRIQVQN